MGLSSSQARLLTLTSRMHDIEYKAAKLEAQKLQMANESRRAYEDYLIALDATKIQLKNIDTDGSIKFVDATYNNLVAAGYEIKFEGLAGRVIPDSEYDAIEELYNKTAPNRNYFIALYTNRITETDNKVSDGTNDIYEIYTADQLKAMSSGKKYRLMSDIEVSAASGTSILGDKSNIDFDGNGYTINVTSGQSLFHDLTDCNVSNMKVINENCTINSIFANKIIGTSTTEISSLISNVYVEGNINAPSNSVGGLACVITGSGTKVEKCTVDVDIDGNNHQYLGGFAKTIQDGAWVDNCISKGTIDAGERFAGGFASFVQGAKVTNSASYTDVTIKPVTSGTSVFDSGAFVAQASNAEFERCSAYGNISNETTLSFSPASHTVVGFIGAVTSGTTTFTKCDSSSNVTSTTDCISGFIGWVNSSAIVEMTDCNASGTLTTNATTGGAGTPQAAAGLIYYAQDPTSDISIENCACSYSTAIEITGANFIQSDYSTSTVKSNNNYALGAQLSRTTNLNSADEIAAGIIYDEFDAGLLHKESDTDDIYGLTTHKDDSEWITNLINCGFAYLYKKDKDGNEYQVSVATDTGLQEVSDEKDLRKAEAKYEADMRKIDAKDKKYDTELAAIDNERNAVKAEMETLKTVAKDNVERTFKLFS